MVFIRRDGSKEDPWLHEKLWVFTAGAIIALVGMLIDNLWVMMAAGLVLAAGVALRFVPRGGQDPERLDEPHDHDEGR